MRDEGELFLAVLSDASRLLSVEPDGWNPLMRMARHAGLVARLEANSSRCQILERLPRPVREQFDAYSLLAAAHRRTIRWEFDRLSRLCPGSMSRRSC